MSNTNDLPNGLTPISDPIFNHEEALRMLKSPEHENYLANQFQEQMMKNLEPKVPNLKSPSLEAQKKPITC